MILNGPNAISDDALICQEPRISFSLDELSGLLQKEAEDLRDLLLRRTHVGAAE